MGPGDPFAPKQASPAKPEEQRPAVAPVDRRMLIGFGAGALLGLCLWQLGLGATLMALIMGGLGMLVAARSDVVARVARELWDRFSYRWLR